MHLVSLSLLLVDCRIRDRCWLVDIVDVTCCCCIQTRLAGECSFEASDRVRERLSPVDDTSPARSVAVAVVIVASRSVSRERRVSVCTFLVEVGTDCQWFSDQSPHLEALDHLFMPCRLCSRGLGWSRRLGRRRRRRVCGELGSRRKRFRPITVWRRDGDSRQSRPQLRGRLCDEELRLTIRRQQILAANCCDGSEARALCLGPLRFINACDGRGACGSREPRRTLLPHLLVRWGHVAVDSGDCYERDESEEVVSLSLRSKIVNALS